MTPHAPAFLEVAVIRAVLSLVIVLSVGTLAGCAGRGQQVPLNIRPLADSSVQAADVPADAVRVAVLPFEDQRPDTSRLGVRRHLGGGETHFTIMDDSAGRLVAEVVADHFTKKGLRAEVHSPGSQDGADVILTGRLLELAANADSKFMRTNISAASKIMVEGRNAADGSVVRMTLNGSGSESVFWFTLEDVERLLGEVLAESLEKLSADTVIEQKTLRLK